jgi:DNA polymerase III subunit delta
MSFSAHAAKPSEGQFIQAISTHPDIRLFLIYGPDESAAADIAHKMAAEYGADAERIDLECDKIRKDPSLLADEAGALSLFGERRLIRLHLPRDEALPAIENLLSAAAAGNPVIATAGNLKKTSKLLKLVQSSKSAMAHICYLPSESEFVTHISAIAKTMGLRLDRTLLQRISAYTGQDRKLAAMELEKLSLYYDASPEAPAIVETSAFEALSAETGEEDVQALINIILGGNIRKLGAALILARGLGVDAVRILRAMQRQVATLTALRSKVDGGIPAGALVQRTPSIFYKERGAVEAQLGRWPSARLAGLNGHLLEIERQVMGAKAESGIVILEQELTKIARAASRAQ